MAKQASELQRVPVERSQATGPTGSTIPPVPPQPAGAVRFLAFSDWRVQDHHEALRFLDSLGGCDLVVYGGDDLDRLLENPGIVQEFASRTRAGRFLFVAGNDDLPGARELLSRVPGAHDLHREPFLHAGFAFVGIEGTTDGRGPTQLTEVAVDELLKAHLKTVTKGRRGKRRPLPIVVSHAPPRGVLDLALRFSQDGGARSIGSTSLRAFLDQQQVPLTICGHVHLCGGRHEALPNGNVVLNIASHDDEGAEGRLAVIDLYGDGQVEVHLRSTARLARGEELSQLIQVGPSRIQHFKERGIKTLGDVSEASRDQLRVPGAGNWHIDRWIRQAALLQSGRAGLEIVDWPEMSFLGEGRFVVWDIETDLAQRQVWLIGVHDTATGESRQFFDAHDEHGCIDGFLTWLLGRGDAQLISYSGSGFEPRVLNAAMRRHGLTDLTGLLSRDVDLCDRIQRYCVGTYREFRLKELASALGFRFRHPEIDGPAVGMMFSRLLAGAPEPDWGPYLEYNQDDVAATLVVLQMARGAYEATAALR